MADTKYGWIVHLDTTRIRRGAITINRWWSGLNDLVFENETWEGAAYSDDPHDTFMAVGPVKYTRGLPGRRATVSWAVLPEHTRHAVAVDLGGIEVHVGWIYQPPFGAWARGPCSHEGWVGETSLNDGWFTIEVETQLGDVDRGNPLYWSHETADAGDLYAEMAQHISERPEIDWPLNVASAQGQRRLREFAGI